MNRDRDVWLHFDKVRFATRDCQDGRLEVFLPSKPDRAFLTICGHNVSAKEMPPLTSLDLTPEGTGGSGFVPSPSVRIQFIGATTPARAAFKIAWTELFHLPRNPDGTLMTSRLTEDGAGNSQQTEGECGFLCPGEGGLCIPSQLVCNGVINCPGVVNGSSIVVGDEAVELCAARAEQSQPPWLLVGVAAAGGVLMALACLILVCRWCCCCCCPKDEDDDY